MRPSARLAAAASGRWTWHATDGEGTHYTVPYLSIRGRDCEITLTPRPPYCDRGNYLAHLWAVGGSALAAQLDHADGWNPGRYYFDLDRAKAECEAWLVKRGQWVADAADAVDPAAIALGRERPAR